MQRRNLLRGIAAMPVLAALPPYLLAEAAPQAAAPRRVRPTDPAWPAAQRWQELSAAVGGNLIEVQSLFAACASAAGGAACRDVTANIRNPFYLADQVAGTQVSGWLDAWTPAPSAYAIRARNTADVVAGVNFARAHNLRLVLKGTGHSYLGTSNAPDSLLIWTHAMNQVTLHEAFVPAGCKVAAVPAVSAAAGAVWIDLYHAVTSEAGRYVQGGGCADVGVAGLVQSGGFGSMSKGFGTAAAGLLEAEIVTADGTVRTVNACTEPDLFWALKGGGGGSWGVVTRVTLRTHEAPQMFGAAWGSVKAHSDEAYRRLIARFVDFYAGSLFNPHWGEQLGLAPDNTLKLSFVSQGLDKAQQQQLWQPFFDWVKADTSSFTVTDEFGVGARAAREWWGVAGNRSMIPDSRPGVPAYHGWWKGDQDQVGMYLHGYDSLWLPAALLRESERPRLVEALFASSRHKDLGLHFNKGLAGAPPAAVASARDTATNPEVCDAFALVIIADGEASAYPGEARKAVDLAAAHADARAIDLATAQLRRIAPRAGSYVSESNYFNRNWRRDYWGVNYSRLRAIKTQYDPEGLFFVHHGVGSEDWSPDGFTRLKRG
jgi:FAD/FMN-containing dehydrogenase